MLPAKELCYLHEFLGFHSSVRYDDRDDILHLIDFGAARDFPKDFTDHYLRLIYAAITKNEDLLLEQSDILGFTTGLK